MLLPILALKLMTYNVNFADVGRADTMAAIESGDADVVLLQEITQSWATQLRDRFAKKYPHMSFHVDTRAAGGLAVLSKVKITDDKIIPATEGWFPAQRLTVDTTLGPVDILHVHLRPALVDGSWVKGYFVTPPIREKEIAAFWTAMPRAPMIVAGDYNEEAGMGVLTFLGGHGLARIDTGTNPTTWDWAGKYAGQDVKLAMNIDHVAIAAKLVATKAVVMSAGKSDHRPVVVTLDAAATP